MSLSSELKQINECENDSWGLGGVLQVNNAHLNTQLFMTYLIKTC